jgi:inner membrane protein
MLSTVYLMWSVGAKLHVNRFAHESLKRQSIGYDNVLTIAAPFNTLLWRVLVMDDRGYYEGFYSLFDQSRDIQFDYHSSAKTLLRDIVDHWPVKRLQWFTHGFYAVNRLIDDIVITDLRMGMEPYYVFRFKVGKIGNPHAIKAKSMQVSSEPDWDQLRWVWQRIWTNEPDMTLTK